MLRTAFAEPSCPCAVLRLGHCRLAQSRAMLRVRLFATVASGCVHRRLSTLCCVGVVCAPCASHVAAGAALCCAAPRSCRGTPGRVRTRGVPSLVR